MERSDWCNAVGVAVGVPPPAVGVPPPAVGVSIIVGVAVAVGIVVTVADGVVLVGVGLATALRDGRP